MSEADQAKNPGPGLVILGATILVVTASIYFRRLDLAALGIVSAFGLFCVGMGIAHIWGGLRE